MIAKEYFDDQKYADECQKANSLVVRDLNGNISYKRNERILHPLCKQMDKKKLQDYKDLVMKVDKATLNMLSGPLAHKKSYKRWINNEAKLLKNLVYKQK